MLLDTDFHGWDWLFFVTVGGRGYGRKNTMCEHSLFVEPDDRISQEVAGVDGFALADDFRVLSTEQPTDVCEEKASSCVVGVGVCLRILVVDTMVSGPLVDVVLKQEKPTL